MYEGIKTILFDLDGTIYYGNQLIDGADEVVQKFREQGKKVYFVTNNSGKTREQISKKLCHMGVHCTIEEIYTSGYVAALYTLKKGYQEAYVFGTNALKQEFQYVGLRVSNTAEVLVVGFDPEFNYQKLSSALQMGLRTKIIIACNIDKNFPGENAVIVPGCGAMVGALEGCLGRKIDFVVGKPNPLLLDMICAQHGLQKDEIMIIGDTYESDIKMAQEYGCSSIYIDFKRCNKLYEKKTMDNKFKSYSIAKNGAVYMEVSCIKDLIKEM